MSAKWPHFPTDLHVGDVFLVEREGNPELKHQAAGIRRIGKSVAVKQPGRDVWDQYAEDEPIRIVGHDR